MVTTTRISETASPPGMVITWEPLPPDFDLEEDEPVDNTGQPLLAGALRESLEITGWIQPQMLIAVNFGLCGTIDGQFIAKAPDWLYVPAVKEILPDRKSYTPHLEGDIPAIVMEFLSDKEGGEYSVKPTYPPGKWFFYEQILQVRVYVIFEPEGGLIEYYQLENGKYELKLPDENGRHWVESMGLFLGDGGIGKGMYCPGQWRRLSQSGGGLSRNGNAPNWKGKPRKNSEPIYNPRVLTLIIYPRLLHRVS